MMLPLKCTIGKFTEICKSKTTKQCGIFFSGIGRGWDQVFDPISTPPHNKCIIYIQICKKLGLIYTKPPYFINLAMPLVLLRNS